MIGGVGISGVVVCCGIAGCCNKQRFLFGGSDNRTSQSLAVSSSTPRVIRRHNVQTMANFQIGQVIQSLDGIGRGPAILTKKLSGNHGHIPVHTHDTRRIAPTATNRPGNVCAMIIKRSVINTVVIVDKVPAIDVVHIAIVVVIDAVHGIKRVDPDVVDEIRMGDLDSRVDNAHENVCRTDETLVPCIFRVNAKLIRGSGRPNGRWRIVTVHPPQIPIGVIGIVTDRRRGVDIVRLRIRNERILLDIQNCIFHGDAVRNRNTFNSPESGCLHSVAVNSFNDRDACLFKCGRRRCR